MKVLTFATAEEAEKSTEFNIHSSDYNGEIFTLNCEECGNEFFSVGFSKYRTATCSCGEDTNGMVVISHYRKLK